MKVLLLKALFSSGASPGKERIFLKKKSSPTIYDVAQEAGVSISTVSRVLNAHERVNESTRNQVLAAIDALGFVPKAEARARALSSSGRVGVITPFFTLPSFVQRLRGVASALTASNYELVIFTVDTHERLQHYLETIPLTHNLDGLIIISVRVDAPIAQRLISHHVETVLIEYPLSEFSSVEIDDVAGGRLAATYLLGKGHRNLVFVGETNFPVYGIDPISSRLAGYWDVLREQNIDFGQHRIWETPHDVAATRRIVTQRLKTEPRPSAIFCATDMQAIGVIEAARGLGIKVPEELAILGFDDLDMSDYIGLSTVRQPLDESGRVAAELLFSRITNADRPVQHVRLPVTIVERTTT